jgi:transcriptional regulator with XRE-family HTH domain
MSKLSKRLLELMTEHNLNASSLAKKLGISHTSINRFLREERTPNFSCFIKMLYIFNCSADYLLGLTELHTDEPLHTVPPFKDRLRALLKERKVSQAQLIKDLPVSSAVPYKWLSGLNEPSVESLLRLAEYFECTVDYLIGRVR